ncbi:hypothetical protein LB505_005416 [Fusarium chuoi]|nr:hypothetical protein LB505_005416 [Fusarium chuoi]
MVSYNFLTIALYAGATLALPQSKTASNPTATIDNGIIIGTSTAIPDTKLKVNQFLGIPFAEKPIRFSPPKPAKPWDSPYNATNEGIKQLRYLLHLGPRLGLVKIA